MAQQAVQGGAVVQCWSDPTITSLLPEDVETWSAAELALGLELLLDQIAPVNMSVPVGSAEASHENLRLIIVTSVRKRVALRDDLLARVPALYGPPAGALADVVVRLDLLEAMVRREFPGEALSVVVRLDHYRRMYPWLDGGALEQVGADVMAGVSAVETAARIHRVATDPGGDAELTAAITALRTANANLLGALLTPHLEANVAEVESARDEWLRELTGSFRRTTLGARDAIAATIDPAAYGSFASGTWDDNHNLLIPPEFVAIYQLEKIRASAVGDLTKLAGEIPVRRAPLETQMEFVVSNTPRLDELLARAEQVTLGVALCEEGRDLENLTSNETYEISQENADGLRVISFALRDLVNTDYTRERMPELRRRVERAREHGAVRIGALQDYQMKVTWFLNIVATLLGVGAMRAVMAVPAVAGLGRAGATIVGSLAFTTTRLALTGNQGRPLTVGGFLGDAAKDYFLLRLLGGVDARIAARTGQAGVLAAAARLGGAYGTLVAWTLTWNALQPGASGPTGSHATSTGDVMVQTGVDLAVLMIAEALLRAPALPPADSALQARDPGAGREARQQWQSLRIELEGTGRHLREWLGGPRADVATGEGLLARAASLFARIKALHARFLEVGEINAAQRTQLDANADAMLESIRNARDEVRLDVRNVTAESLSYRGSPENLSAYLERLKTQGRAKEVTDEGGGVYSVRGSDGVLYWFFPAGRQAPAIIDMVADSVEASAPDVSSSVRGQAIAHLRGAGWADLGSFAGGLPTGRGGPFVEWVARPDVGAVLADGGLPMPVVRQLAQGPAPDLELVAAGDPRVLPLWYRAWAGSHLTGQPSDFAAALADVAAWRGTLDVSGPFEATSLLGRRALAQASTEIVFPSAGPSSSGPAFIATPTTPGPVPAALKGEVVKGARYLQTMRIDRYFVVEIIGGRVTRMFELVADGTVVRRVPVATHMAALREILIKLGSMVAGADARAVLAHADPLLAELDPLLDFRDGVPAEQVHLMEALASHPLRSGWLHPLGSAAPSAPAAPPGPPVPNAPRAPRRIVVRPGAPAPQTGPAIDLGETSRLTRRPNGPESAFVDRVIEAEERAYQESLGGKAGRGGENPARWARVQPTLARLVAAMRAMQARLQRAGQGHLLPDVSDAVLDQPIDRFVNRNPVLRQMQLEIEARLREHAANDRQELAESPEWKVLQKFLGRGKKKAGANPSMGALQPDLVELMLDEGSIHISDVTTQKLDPLGVHAFKTRVYVEIIREIVGRNGPRVSGQDIEMHTDTSGQRIDPTRTRFGDIIE